MAQLSQVTSILFAARRGPGRVPALLRIHALRALANGGARFSVPGATSRSFTRRKSRTSNNPVPVLRIPSKYGWTSSLNKSNLTRFRHMLQPWAQGAELSRRRLGTASLYRCIGVSFVVSKASSNMLTAGAAAPAAVKPPAPAVESKLLHCGGQAVSWYLLNKVFFHAGG